MEASRARMLARTATGADARDDREGARIAAVRRAVRGAAASTSYSTPSSARVVVRPETTRANLSEESSPRLTRAAQVLREAKALMRELSPSSTLGTPSSAGGSAASSAEAATESRWRSLRKSYDAIEADKAAASIDAAEGPDDGPTPPPRKQLFTAAMRRWKASDSRLNAVPTPPGEREPREPTRVVRAANGAAELSATLRPVAGRPDAREILARAADIAAGASCVGAAGRVKPARTSSPARFRDAIVLDRTRAARQRMEARRHAADDEVRALRERLRREAEKAERERSAMEAEAEEASIAARLAAAKAAKERRLAAAKAAIATREDAERRRRIAEEVEAAEAEAREAAKEREVERVRAKELVEAAREVEERNATRERTRRMASALGAWRDVALREARGDGPEARARVEAMRWRLRRRVLRAWFAAAEDEKTKRSATRLAREAEMGNIARLHRERGVVRGYVAAWRDVAARGARARREEAAEESRAREAAAEEEAAAAEKRAAAARKEAEALAAADAAAAEERRVKKEALLARVGATAANEEATAEAAMDRSRESAGAPAARESADDATVADLLEFVNLAKRVHTDLGGVPLGSPTKADADEDDEDDEDLGSPPKRRKTGTGLASVMEDDDDAAGALLAGANPWMHAPPVVPAPDPGPGRREPVKGTNGSVKGTIGSVKGTIGSVKGTIGSDGAAGEGTKAATMARRAAARAAARGELRAKAAAAREAAIVREAQKALLEGEAERALEAARRAEALSARRASKAAEERKRRAAVIAAESTALAVAHHQRALSLRAGIKPWRALVAAARAAAREAEYRAGTTIARVPFRAWSNRAAFKVSSLRDGAAVISAMDDRRASSRVLRAWSGWSRASTLASFRAKAKGWDAWVEVVQAAAASVEAACDCRRRSLMKRGWNAWKLAARARLERLEREAHAAWLEETRRIGRGALREWRRAAVAAASARREAETKDRLFLKVGRWLEELRADKALTPSPASKGPSPENREERRARYKSGLTPVATPRDPGKKEPLATMTSGLNLAAAPVPELAMLRLRSMPQYARVMQAASEASAAVSAAPAASPSSYVTPPRTQSKIPLPVPKAPALHATPAPPPARAERKDDWLDLDVTPPRVDLLGLTRGVTRSPLGAMAVNIEVDSPDLNLMRMAKERPKVKARAKVNSNKPAVDKPTKEVSPGGLSKGSRARLEKLAAKKRGQAKDRQDFWKRVG